MAVSHRFRVLVLLVAGALLLPGCTTNLVRRGVQRRLSRKLETWIGPAEQYQVRIYDTRDAELALGRAHRVEIRGRRIFVQRQLMVDTLRLNLYDLRYEGGDPDLIDVRRSDLEVEVTEQALNDYLKSFQSRYEPEVRFTAEGVTARLTYPLLGKPTPVQATGRFEIQEGRRLFFKAEKADIPLLSAPGFSERFVEDRINPLLDLGRIDFPARLENVQVLPGRLRAYGTAAIRREVND